MEQMIESSGAKMERKQPLIQYTKEIKKKMGLCKKFFADTKMEGYDFREVDLSNAVFVNCSLIGANFSFVNLENAVFVNCNLTNVIWHKAWSNNTVIIDGTEKYLTNDNLQFHETTNEMRADIKGEGCSMAVLGVQNYPEDKNAMERINTRILKNNYIAAGTRIFESVSDQTVISHMKTIYMGLDSHMVKLKKQIPNFMNFFITVWQMIQQDIPSAAVWHYCAQKVIQSFWKNCTSSQKKFAQTVEI